MTAPPMLSRFSHQKRGGNSGSSAGSMVGGVSSTLFMSCGLAGVHGSIPEVTARIKERWPGELRLDTTWDGW